MCLVLPLAGFGAQQTPCVSWVVDKPQRPVDGGAVAGGLEEFGLDSGFVKRPGVPLGLAGVGGSLCGLGCSWGLGVGFLVRGLAMWLVVSGS
jgi:hypothetical protein